MRRQRKRKAPITTTEDNRSASRHSTRTLIRLFHILLKRRAALLGSESSTSHDAASLLEVEKEIEGLGGLSAYQRMSTIGQANDRGGGSEKRLIAWLKEIGLLPGTCEMQKLKLLEVGALKPDNFRTCASWIDVTPIDLRSQHPEITEQDFLLMDPSENRCRWDLLSLSLVLNFVPNARDRGRMLRTAHDMLVDSGLLFLVLPLPCVDNSRYLTFDHLETLMRAIGFAQLRSEWRNDGKMAYWLYRKTKSCDPCGPSPPVTVEQLQRKVVLRQGNRNNFCILL